MGNRNSAFPEEDEGHIVASMDNRNADRLRVQNERSRQSYDDPSDNGEKSGNGYKSARSEDKKSVDGEEKSEYHDANGGNNDEEEERKKAASKGFARMPSTDSLVANAPLTKTALDDETLHILRDYLKSGEFDRDTLEEEDVANFSITTSRYVKERTRYRQNLLEDSGMCDGETYYDRVYKEEEFYALANEFFKTVVTEAQTMASEDGSKNIKMHSKTVSWVKRAAGLQRPYDPLEHAAYMSESDEGETDAEDAGPRRLTRGMARNTRVKRREERCQKETEGLRALSDAIEGLEKERGEPFPESRRFARSGDKPSFANDRLDDVFRDDQSNDNQSNDSLNIQYARSDPIPPPGPKLVAILPNGSDTAPKEMNITSLLVQGRHVSGATEAEILEWRRERKRIRNREYYRERKAAKMGDADRKRMRSGATTMLGHSTKDANRIRMRSGATTMLGHSTIEAEQKPKCLSERTNGYEDKRRDSSGRKKRLFAKVSSRNLRHPTSDQENFKDPIQLSLLAWERQTKLEEKESFDDEKLRELTPIPPTLVTEGLEHRPREDKLSNPRHLTRGDPPKKLPDKFYASCCKKLISFLSGKARSWALHEFFYSDIDRAWYLFNDFASEAAKLGVPPSMRLTRREWSMVRRRMRLRPRRFSRSFIVSQLEKRNRYRSMVRQQQPTSNDYIATGFDVPAPIQVGTIVTAYNRRYRVLHRGVVLFRDPEEHSYLVQFDRKELGYELCPDTEVASLGSSTILHHAGESPWKGGTLGYMRSPFSNTGTVPYGSKDRHDPNLNISTRKELEGDVLQFAEYPEESAGSPVDTSEDSCKKSLNNEIERNILVSTMAAIEKAIERKKMILKALAMHNCRKRNQGRDTNSYNEFDRGISRDDMPQHRPWLLANLELTNHTLDVALFHMQTVYGKAYYKTKRVSPQSPSMAIQEVASKNSGSIDHASSMLWASSLTKSSDELGGILANCLEDIESLKTQQQHLSSAASLLLTASYGCDRATGSRDRSSSEAVDAALQVGFDRYVQQSIAFDAHGTVEERAHRDGAVAELKEAIDLLRAEMSASNRS